MDIGEVEHMLHDFGVLEGLLLYAMHDPEIHLFLRHGKGRKRKNANHRHQSFHMSLEHNRAFGAIQSFLGIARYGSALRLEVLPMGGHAAPWEFF